MKSGSAAGTSKPAAAGGKPGNTPCSVKKGAATPSKKPAPSNGTPPRIVVRQGGSSEPNIQLAGNTAGAHPADTRQTANQMLEATETNLKKMQGVQLKSSQRDMVNQVHQFVDQSKEASAAGDVDRARTLAWKAQLLSEELLAPQK